VHQFIIWVYIGMSLSVPHLLTILPLPTSLPMVLLTTISLHSISPYARCRSLMTRDPISLQAIEYYSRLPQTINVDRIFILDPMVATGNTALAALKMMKEWGLEMNKVSFLGIIGSKKALEGIEKKYPEVEVSLISHDMPKQ
jgi:uracil phosphoribosyltransferase